MPLFRDLRHYTRRALGVLLRQPTAIARLGREFPRWRRSLVTPRSLEMAQPWLTFGAIEFLESQLPPRAHVFEWGAGGSTLFFAGRQVVLTSVEHDADWFAGVRAGLATRGHEVAALELIRPEIMTDSAVDDPADPGSAVSSSEGCQGMTFRHYASAIDRFPDDHFDLVLVDGRARPTCLQYARGKVRPGGWLLLDDANRPHYQPAQRLFDPPRWRVRDWPGAVPGQRSFGWTRGWQRVA